MSELEIQWFSKLFFNPQDPLLKGSSMEIQCVKHLAAVIEEDNERVETSPISHPAPTLPVLQIPSPIGGVS